MTRWLGFFVSASLVALACGDDARRSKHHDDGGGGSSSGPSSGGTSGPGGDATSGPSSGPGGSCTPGCLACQAFDECCSGICDNQVCTHCGGEGEPCGADGCCLGLTCNPADDTCGSCKLEGDLCDLASDCCSNVCDQGFCALPTCDFGDCASCTLSDCAKAVCAGAWQSCAQDPACTSYDACAQRCAGNQLCIQGCADQNPAGFEAHLSYEDCAACSEGACIEECGCA